MRMKKRGKKENSRLGLKLGNLASSRRSQVTIFIIIAIVILAILLIIFYPNIKRTFFPSAPVIQLENCINDKVEEGLDLISLQGGSISPVNVYSYQGNQVEYLCYTNQYYQNCIMQQPLLKQHIERELLEYIQQDLRACINNVKSELESKGYTVEGNGDSSLELSPGKINLDVSGIYARQGDTGSSYNKFELEFNSRMYEMVMLTSSILNWEARYGDSETTIYMTYYPDIKVEKLKQSDGSKIYIITDRKNDDKFMFATRSLSWPPGYWQNQIYTPQAVLS